MKVNFTKTERYLPLDKHAFGEYTDTYSYIGPSVQNRDVIILKYLRPIDFANLPYYLLRWYFSVDSALHLLHIPV